MPAWFSELFGGGSGDEDGRVVVGGYGTGEEDDGAGFGALDALDGGWDV